MKSSRVQGHGQPPIMAETSDSRFVDDERFDSECEAESSIPVGKRVEDTGTGPEDDGLVDGMDPEGFLGPSEKVVKPLTSEALAAYKAAQDRAGVIYVSRIPPGMQPPKVRHLLSAYGDIGRVYLQPEGESDPPA